MRLCFKKLFPLILIILMVLLIPQAFALDADNSTQANLMEDMEIEDVSDGDILTSDEDFGESISSPSFEDVQSVQEDGIYVAVDGDDSNDGSQASPYKTLYRAVNVALDSGITNIYVKEGIYKENSIPIETSVNIRGIGNVIIDAEQIDRIFKIDGEYEVELSNLTLINGVAPEDGVTWDIHEVSYYAGGGAISIISAYVKMNYMTFINNTANEFGGAINVEAPNCQINNSLFMYNYAGVFGGAIDFEDNNCSVINCTFIYNEASNGGAIGYIGNTGLIIDSYFENNTAENGAAIFIENGPLTFDDSNSHLIKNNKFIHNEAIQQGGAIEVENQQMSENADWTLIDGNEFIDNYAYNGGAISAYYGDAGITNNKFINNTAGYGGAIAGISTTDSSYIIIGGLYLKNNTMINCIAEENGNTIYNMGYFGTEVNITFCDGKKVYCPDGKAVILNVTVCDDMGNPISGSPLEFTVDGKATINPATDLVEGKGSVRFVPRENGTFIVSGIFKNKFNTKIINLVTGEIEVENAIADYFGTIYVSQLDGDDDNTGAEGSPVKTFNQGYVLATRNGGSFDIVVREGTYEVKGYTVEKSFNITGIGNPILDGKNQKTLFSLYGAPNDEFHITGVTFKNGVANPSKYGGMEEGGAIFFKGGKLYLEDDTFTSNSAKSYGGAVHINKGMDAGGNFYRAFAYISNCTFKNNLADYFGGAISLYDSDVYVTNCNFVSNKAKNGGAISILNGMANLTVINSSFTSNFASDMGGALEIDALKTYSTKYFANVVNSTFNSNNANYGGAIIAGDSNISNCIFTNNKAVYQGGAIFNNETFLGEPIKDQTSIENCIFENNTAESGLNYWGTSIFVNNNFWGNNFKSLDDLIGSNVLFFVTKNNNLSWVNIVLEGLENITIGNYTYTCKFVSNNGSELSGYLPNYNVKISNKVLDNKLDAESLLISNNKVSVNYNASESAKDTISIFNGYCEFITSKDIEVASGANDTEDNSTNATNATDDNSTSTNATNTTDNPPVSVTKVATKLTVPNKTFIVTSTSKKLVITLKDAYGNPLSKKTIKVKLNGVTKSYKTNSKGQITTSKINLKVKSYKVTVSFAGDNLYKATSKSATIKIIKQKTKLSVPKKTFKKSSKSKKLTATLKTSGGKPIAKKKVVFKVNGKKYSAKTNKNGKVTVKVKLTSKKTYKFTVRFAGDSKYTGVTKKSSVKIK